METLVYLDTHTLIWLYEGKIEKFPHKALQLIEHEKLVTSGINELELHYLYEIGKITQEPEEIIQSLAHRIELSVKSSDLVEIMEHTKKLSWTRDPFDRLMVAQAQNDGAVLITKDQHILTHYTQALWE